MLCYFRVDAKQHYNTHAFIYIYIFIILFIYIYIYIQDCLRKLEYCDKVLYFL